MAIVYKPNKRKRKKIHGFLERMKDRTGKKVIASRRRKKRHSLTV
jgi:large subunit ribosomal protein L34